MEVQELGLDGLLLLTLKEIRDNFALALSIYLSQFSILTCYL